jgi:hypothetical protein
VVLRAPERAARQRVVDAPPPPTPRRKRRAGASAGVLAGSGQVVGASLASRRRGAGWIPVRREASAGVLEGNVRKALGTTAPRGSVRDKTR